MQFSSTTHTEYTINTTAFYISTTRLDSSVLLISAKKRVDCINVHYTEIPELIEALQALHKELSK